MSNAFRNYMPESETRSQEVEGTTDIALMSLPNQYLEVHGLVII